jgi:hypothetical protein
LVKIEQTIPVDGWWGFAPFTQPDGKRKTLLMTQVNWQSGRIDLLSDIDVGVAWSLVIAGDWAPLGDHGQAMICDPIRFYGDLGSVLQGADLAIVNVEGVLGDAGKPVVKDGWHMRLPKASIEGLTAGSFRLACLANNHSMDFGLQGLTHTRQLLSERGIPSVGAGLDSLEACRPFITQIGGVRLAVVNATEGEEGRSVDGGPGVADLDQDRLIQQIEALQEQVDVIVAILHGGREFVPAPPPYVQRIYRALVNAGADLVVGHHPHVPQGVEVYQGRPIVYSLGNFALWMPVGSPFKRLGYLVKGHFCGAKLISMEIIPYRIQAGGLALLKDDECAAFLADLAQASSPLLDPSKVEAVWCAYADCWLKHGLAQDLLAISSLLLDEADLRAAWLNALSGRRASWARLARKGVRILTRLAARLTDSQDDQRQARGAAILHNRFDTPAHRELYLTALRRRMNLHREPQPDWALDLIKRWKVFDPDRSRMERNQHGQ